MKDRVVGGFNTSRAVILISRTGMTVEKIKLSKIPNWRYYLLKTRAKRKKNWQKHWEWLNKPFRNASKPWGWFRSREIGFRTSWSREVLNGVSLLVNSFFKDIIGRGYYMALWPATRNGSTTIIPSAENNGECPDMPSRRRLDRIFTVPRLCSGFGGISSVWCVMSCWNPVKPSYRIGIERNGCVWSEHWRRNGHSTRRDTTKLSTSITINRKSLLENKASNSGKKRRKQSCTPNTKIS